MIWCYWELCSRHNWPCLIRHCVRLKRPAGDFNTDSIKSWPAIRVCQWLMGACMPQDFAGKSNSLKRVPLAVFQEACARRRDSLSVDNMMVMKFYWLLTTSFLNYRLRMWETHLLFRPRHLVENFGDGSTAEHYSMKFSSLR